MLLSQKSISKAHRPTACKVAVGKHELERVNQIKYLGIVFDNKLAWKPHIQQIDSNLSGGSLALLKLRNFVDLQTLKTVYYSVMYPHLRYCISTRGLACAIDLDPFEKLHKCIIRNVTWSSYLEHTSPLF